VEGIGGNDHGERGERGRTEVARKWWTERVMSRRCYTEGEKEKYGIPSARLFICLRSLGFG